MDGERRDRSLALSGESLRSLPCLLRSLLRLSEVDFRLFSSSRRRSSPRLRRSSSLSRFFSALVSTELPSPLRLPDLLLTSSVDLSLCERFDFRSLRRSRERDRLLRLLDSRLRSRRDSCDLDLDLDRLRRRRSSGFVVPALVGLIYKSRLLPMLNKLVNKILLKNVKTNYQRRLQVCRCPPASRRRPASRHRPTLRIRCRTWRRGHLQRTAC